MKILVVRYYQYNNIISNVELAPEKYSEKDVANHIEKYNKGQEDNYYKYFILDDEISECIEFLIKDRNTDKNRLLDAVADLKKGIDDLLCGIDDTYNFIANELKNESEEKK